VNDVLAAAEFLRAQPGVDADRVYLGGHSTGGTLALLVAATDSRFRAIFAFGPVTNASDYGGDQLTYDPTDLREDLLRNPASWLHAIRSRTFVFEGEENPGNSDSLRRLKKYSRNPLIQFHPVQGKDHFSVLAPYSRTLAQKIMADTAAKPVFEF
jgi:acetyl esterase/lipase